MLYWGIFTTGFIIGVFVALAILQSKGGVKNETPSTEDVAIDDPWKVHERLIEINHPSISA